ncbi:MAG: hypothetical protein WAL25_14045 [Acidimicrobiia bacterium]
MIVASVRGLIVGTSLVSVLFGSIVAGMARSAGPRAHPGMRLRSSPSATALWGGVVGLVLGAVAGAVLAVGVGSSVDGDQALVQLPVLATLIVVVLGGAVLGVTTAAMTQIFAVPIVVEDGAEEEIDAIRARLVDAVRIPVTALLFLLMLVLPLGWTLVEAAPLNTAAAPLVATLVAGGILGFASLVGNRPNIRISIGEFGVALAGTLAIVGLVLSVMFARGPAAPEVHGPGGTVMVVATPDFTFDESAWSVPEGEVTFVYQDGADLVHTLAIEGKEDEMELRVQDQGDEDTGTVNLPPGTYTLYCTIRGHRELGMEGALTVEPAPDESPPPSDEGA